MNAGPPRESDSSAFRLRWTLGRKIGGLAAVLLLLILAIALYSSAKLRGIGREVGEITRRDLRIKRAARRMERYQLNQNVSLEGIRRRALEEGEGTKAQRDERIAQFQRFSTLFCEEMRKTESLLTQAAAAPWGHCRLPIAN